MQEISKKDRSKIASFILSLYRIYTVNSLTTKAGILLLKVRTSAKCDPKKAITFYKNTQTCFLTPIFLK